MENLNTIALTSTCSGTLLKIFKTKEITIPNIVIAQIAY